MKLAPIYFVLISIYSIFAQVEVELTGVITDRQGRPLPSIVVTLASQNLSDTTDIEGKYALVSPSSSSEGLYSSSSLAPSSSSLAFSSSSQIPSSSSIASSSSSSEAIFSSSSEYLSSSSYEPPLRLLNAQRQSYTGSTQYFSVNGKKWQSPRLWNLSRQPYYQKNQKVPQALKNRQALAFATASDELQVTQNGTPLAKIPVVSYKAALGATAVIPYTTFTDDRDGRIYRYVEIGGQYWMAQNLNYGDMVAPTSGQDEDDIAEKYCLGNDTLNCTKWGGLYTWSEAMGLPSWCNTLSCATKINAAGHQGICPTGWTLPTAADWASLVANTTGDASTAGLELKSDTGWVMNYDGTNSYGFSALPIGNRNAKKNFVNYGTHAYWWTADEYSAEYAHNQFIYAYQDRLNASTSHKSDFGFGTRCFYTGGLDSNGLPPVAPGDGYVIWEKWKHLRGSSLSKVPWNTAPGDTGRWNILVAPTDNDDRFGLRVRGFITAPLSGYYTFNLYTNGTASFDLGTSQSVGTLRQILPQANTTSAPVYLARGSKYYFTAYWKENWQNEYFEIQWKTPEMASSAPFTAVPGMWLSPAPLSTYKVNPPVCATITPTAKDSDWPAYCTAADGNCGTFIDERNCQEYRWTQIGTQKWMAENLNIGTMVNGSQDQGDEAVIEKYCYNNDPGNCAVYGGLYQWHEAMGLPNNCDNATCWDNSPQYGKQGICPDGWIMPAQSDMQNLIDNTTGLDSTAATNLKYTTWSASSSNGWGFSAFPGGMRSTANTFVGLGTQTQWWISEELLEGHSWLQRIDATSMLKRGYGLKRSFGLATRCVEAGSQTIWGSVTWARWDGDYSLDLIPASEPSASGKWSMFEAPENLMDHYTYKIHGIVQLPSVLSYTFAISSNDQGQLYLSSDQNSTNKVLIASSPAVVAPRTWAVSSSQQSSTVLFQNSASRYIEANLKENTSGDHLAISFSNNANLNNRKTIINGSILQ